MTSLHTLSPDVPVLCLSTTSAFQNLTENEKLYVHWLSQACWRGSPIVFEQISPESPTIFRLFIRLFSAQTIESLRHSCLQSDSVTAEDFLDFLCFAATFFANHGNYQSFGDTKFVPRLCKESFCRIVEASCCRGMYRRKLMKLLATCIDSIYSLKDDELMLNFPETGVSGYYSKNVKRSDIELVQRFLLAQNLSAYNTRIFRNSEKSLEVVLAAASSNQETFAFEGYEITIRAGDYATHMQSISDALNCACAYASNTTQVNMLKAYVRFFNTGSIEEHRDAQRFWIKDRCPSVETNIGFIESYRDPSGVRGEFEGFCAIVNKETSLKFSKLVDCAPKFLETLPWDSNFEKDIFLKPDFTSLEVLTFSGSGIPAGINIPNYDDIRQSEGFKNVSLGNVLSAYEEKTTVSFLQKADQTIYQSLRGKSFEVQVGGHELLGHGSGKLFAEDASGSLNFACDSVVNPLTGKSISSWYKPGETFDSVFGQMGSSYEECRAECVGLLLSVDHDFLKIFGFEGRLADDVTYVNWLNMTRAGILALEFYSPEENKWRQAHMQARFAILQVFLQAGEGFLQIDGCLERYSNFTKTADEKNPVIFLDRSKIPTVGVPAIREFLNRIQVFKSTADIDSAKAMYGSYTTVNSNFLHLRETVLDRKKPRRIFVQANTLISNGRVEIIEYPPTFSGLIQSFIDRFDTCDL